MRENQKLREILNIYVLYFLLSYLHLLINNYSRLKTNYGLFSIDLDKFIQSEHSTYFARLVALRMNMSRFLGGRYYTLSNNYGRLMQQTTRILQYFKTTEIAASQLSTLK